jgi:hypothetical protein
VTTISDGAFRECSSLAAITIPTGVTKIGFVAFNGCSSLTDITIPDGLTTICFGAFQGCSLLSAITMPDSVTSIGQCAFYGCAALTSFTLSPAAAIGPNCFTNCAILISAAADKNMPTVEDLLHYRWRRKPAVMERVTALLCLKGTWDHAENQHVGPDSQMDGAGALRVTEAREKIPKVLWRVILEFV